MKISISEQDGIVTVEASGLLSGSQGATEEFRRLSERIGEDTITALYLDFERVSFVDSMVLGLLIGVLLKCTEHNVFFKFTRISQQALQTFEFTNVTRLFPSGALPEE